MAGKIGIPPVDCNNCEIKSPLFCLLTEKELEAINQSRITVQFRKGETIRKQGTFMSHVISLNSGLAKLYIEGIDQRNAILRIVKPTNFIGGPGIYLDQRHHFSITALIDSTVCFIDVAIFKEIIDNNRAFSAEFMREFSKSVLSVYNRLVFLTQKQMHGRMADTLIYLFDEIFESRKFPMYLSRQDISELSGMSKDSAVKLLREFQQDGLIDFTDNEMIIKNPEAIYRISKTG